MRVPLLVLLVCGLLAVSLASNVEDVVPKTPEDLKEALAEIGFEEPNRQQHHQQLDEADEEGDSLEGEEGSRGGVDDDEEYTSETLQMLSALFKDPEAVAASNQFLAPDRTSRHLFNEVDNTRDEYMQIYGVLKEEGANDDCDAVHAAARRVVGLHHRYATLTLQANHLSSVEKQAVSEYVQDRLAPIAHTVAQQVVTGMLSCEKGARGYAESVAGISLMTGRIESLRTDLFHDPENCVKLQALFHQFSDEVEDFHNHAASRMAIMRSRNRISDAERAGLEVSARMAPSEREFYSTFHALWARNCRAKVDEALGLKPAAEEGSSSGSSSSAKMEIDSHVTLKSGGRSGRFTKLFATRDDTGFEMLASTDSGAVSSGASASTASTSSSSASGGGSSSSSAASSGVDSQAAAPAQSYSFPAAYPRNVHTLLLVATVGMIVCAAVFLWWRTIAPESDTLIHTVVFLLTAVAGCSYLALYTGMGVGVKIDASNVPHAILWARQYELIITIPLLTLAISLYAQTESARSVAIMGSSALMAASWLIGAAAVGEGQISWWAISIVFFIMTAAQWANQLAVARDCVSERTNQTLQILIGLQALACVSYLTIYIIGGEGLSLISLTTEVGLDVFTDLVSKLGFGFYLLGAVQDNAMPSGESGRLLATSSRYV